jgi:hypothetical protein
MTSDHDGNQPKQPVTTHRANRDQLTLSGIATGGVRVMAAGISINANKRARTVIDDGDLEIAIKRQCD